jgi:citrate lyase beta subunit
MSPIADSARARRPIAHARSLLFVPATRPDRYAKALATQADVVVIDLEDAVAPGDKDEGRTLLTHWLSSHCAVPVAIRINGTGTPTADADLRLLGRFCGSPNISAVVVPKAETAQDVARVTAVVGGTTPVLPIIESAAGLDGASGVASAPGVVRLLCGDLDLALDLGCDFDARDGLVAAVAKFPIVLASRLAGLAKPVDGPEVDVSDPLRTLHSARRASALGFGGKICIHPGQVQPVHEGFAASPEEKERAERIVSAASTGGGAFQLDGRMIDKPVVDRAYQILDAS